MRNREVKTINKALLGAAFITLMAGTNAMAMDKVYDNASLRDAIDAANSDSSIKKIVFEKNAQVSLTAPVIYSGSQALTIIGNNATVDGSGTGDFTLNDDLTPVLKDGALVFNTASDITIRKLTVENSSIRGIVINIPEDAEGEDIDISLHKVNITGSALYGLHIDDNIDEFDDGDSGSVIGVDLYIMKSTFTDNGTGAIDVDGVRVDERGDGDITAAIMHTRIDSNGGDGIELDEAGAGNVDATMMHVSVNDNGFYNEQDLDDAFDIDEADEGDIIVNLFNVQANNNMDEGLDFDEKGDGGVEMRLRRVEVLDNADEGIKVDEEDGGDINARLARVSVIDCGDDGIQFTELGEGAIETSLRKVTADNNKKYGIKIEQWFEEDEAEPVEDAGSVKTMNVSLSGNGKGDEIKTNNVNVN